MMAVTDLNLTPAERQLIQAYRFLNDDAQGFALNWVRTRLTKLENQSCASRHTGCLRIIQDGDLTQEQQQEIAAADAAGKLVIIRTIVRPVH